MGWLDAGFGNDYISGGGRIYGRSGSDQIHASAGGDVILPGSGRDWVYVGAEERGPHPGPRPVKRRLCVVLRRAGHGFRRLTRFLQNCERVRRQGAARVLPLGLDPEYTPQLGVDIWCPPNGSSVCVTRSR